MGAYLASVLDGIPWERILGAYLGSIPWERALETYLGSISWERTLDVYFGVVPWEGALGAYLWGAKTLIFACVFYGSEPQIVFLLLRLFNDWHERGTICSAQMCPNYKTDDQKQASGNSEADLLLSTGNGLRPV